MSSKVKQANFRLPLDYMAKIDDFAKRESITKAAVIIRALDCMQASYDSGNGGMPVVGSGASGVSEEEFEALKKQLAQAETRAEEATKSLDAASARAASAEQARDAAEARANDAVIARDAAEAKARESATELATAQTQAGVTTAPAVSVAAAAADEELARLRELIAKQEASLEEKTKALAAKEAEIAEKNAAIAERDARITSLSEQLGAANAKIELAMNSSEVTAVPIGNTKSADDESVRAMSMLNMLGGVMGAFQQQTDDARIIGEQEGREKAQKEYQDMVDKARNEGYRDAMGYLDNRVTSAREAGAREERARIANMAFFERRRYLKMHIA